MKLFWKIYCVVFISFVAVTALTSYVTSAIRISDAENTVAEEHRTMGSLIASDIQRSQSESKWPFESLKKLSEDSDHILWWIVREDGIIHLADKASFIGSSSYDYFPQTAGMSLDDDVLLNTRQNYGLVIKSFRTGKDKWAFWLGFSTKHIAEASRRIILSTAIYSVLALVVLGLVLYFVIIHFLRPVENLTVGVEKIGKGDLHHRVEVKSNDELGYLAHSFNKMTEDLKKTTTSIDNLNDVNRQLRASQQQLEANEEKLRDNMNRLMRFNRLAVKRELRMTELKREINSLLDELGRERKYKDKSETANIFSTKS
jgi:methyl-accepting chemotaxis protein